MRILGIETSCDETSASVVEYNRGSFKVLSNIVASQIMLHRRTGGVVPEVAAREHLKNIMPVIDKALKKSKTSPKNIDRIGVVTGPGLITSLIVGSETAKHLAYLWKKKIYSINHIEAHIAANYLLNQKIKYPALCLVVSGGHTEIILMKKLGSYQLIGATRDDAAGECFDKCAKILGLPYPGGPEISNLAGEGEHNIPLPRPMYHSPDFDFSFSGLKTAVLYYKREHLSTLKLRQTSKKNNLKDLCASVQQAIVDVLIYKLQKAVYQYKVKTVLLAGGVAANLELRRRSRNNFDAVLIPDLQYCTDNAAMVAASTAYKQKADDVLKIKVDPNYELSR